MKKFFSLLFLLVALTASAGTISEDEALKLAEGFMGKHAAQQVHGVKAQQLRLAGKASGAYLFNRGTDGGYVIVSEADDARQPVLGYATTGTIDPDNMPDGMKWWLQKTQQGVARGVKTSADINKNYQDIAPMVETKWSQDYPYNILCPKWSDGQAVTGCVATGVAQVMAYHKWPVTGTGSHTYTSSSDKQHTIELSRDFTQSTYQWDLMQNTYPKEGTPGDAENAVARLMADVGIALDMSYGVNSSGTGDFPPLNALTQYFGYDPELRLRYMGNYPLTDWMDTVYTELSEQRPLIYVGSGSGGGHCFVLDGYQDGGYFHFNWGWSGVSDGYFLLTALFPVTQGTGGGNDFNVSECAFIGVKPNKTGSTAETDPAVFTCIPPTFALDGTTVGSGATMTVSADVFTLSTDTHTGYLGLKLTDKETGAVSYVKADNPEAVTLIQPYYATDNNYFTDVYTMQGLSGFPTTDGTQKQYTLLPAFQSATSGKWYDAQFHNILKEKIFTNKTNNIVDTVTVATVTGSTVTLERVATGLYSAEVTATDVTMPAQGIMSQQFRISADYATTEGEYKGCVYAIAQLLPPEEGDEPTDPEEGEGEEYEPVVIGYTTVNVDASHPANVTMACSLDSLMPLGTYAIRLYDKYERPISDAYSVEVLPTVDYEFAATFTDSVLISATDELKFSTKVRCTKGYFYDALIPIAFATKDETDIKKFVSLYQYPLNIAAGEEKTLTITLPLSAETFTTGQTYYLRMYYQNLLLEVLPIDEGWVLPFTVGQNPTAIQGVTETAPAAQRIYNAAGQPIPGSLSTQRPGLYLIKTAEGVRKVSVK